MVSRRTRVVSWIFRRDHPSRPKAMICCFFSSFKTFAMSREATDPPAAVNVLDVSSESMAAFQVFLYGRFWVFTEELINQLLTDYKKPEDIIGENGLLKQLTKASRDCGALRLRSLKVAARSSHMRKSSCWSLSWKSWNATWGHAKINQPCPHA